MDKRVQDLIEERDMIKGELLRVEAELFQALESYRGSVMDAVVDGLVRLNFSAPYGFRKEVRERRQELRRKAAELERD